MSGFGTGTTSTSGTTSTGGRTGDGRTGAGATIRLVAGREISTRLRSKSFRWVTGLLLVLVVGGGVALHLATQSPSTKQLALVPGTQALSTTLETGGTASGLHLSAVDVPDDAAARAKVQDGTVAAALTGTPDHFTVVVKSQLDPSLSTLLTEVRRQVALSAVVTRLGGDPAAVQQQLAAATLDVQALQPPPTREPAQIVAGYLAGILLFIALQTGAQLVAQGVVEEKSSRVVELLLAAIRPWQLMAGKVIGIGVIGLIQVVVLVVGAAGTATATGLVKPGQIALGATAAWTLAWFVVGFAMYALVLAALAALVSRQEDVGSVTAPVIMLMVVPYMIGISVGPFNPTSPLIVWLSYIPFASPLVMPIRVALGTVATWQVLVSLAISVALIPGLVWGAGRIYSNAVVRMGARIRLRDALHSA